MSEQKFSEWVVLELMGHRRLAGLLSEQEIAGSGFLRLEIPGAEAVPAKHFNYEPGMTNPRAGCAHTAGQSCGYYCQPAKPEIPAATQFYAPSAVYAITPVTEEFARRVAASTRYEPVNRFDLPQLAAPERQEEEAAV